MGADSDTNPQRSNKSEKTHVKKGKGYDGEVVASRGQSRLTMFGSLFFDEQPGRAVAVLGRESVPPRVKDLLPTTVCDGESMPGEVVLNSSGGVTNSCVMQVFEKAIFWRWDLTDGKTRVLVLDGCGVHIDPQFLRDLRKLNIMLVLRVPYGSSKLQPEDLLLFWIVKNDKDVGFYKMKQIKIGILRGMKNKQRGGKEKTTVALDYLHILECVKPGFEKAFSPEPIGTSTGWRTPWKKNQETGSDKLLPYNI